jgi:hypothetical protein
MDHEELGSEVYELHAPRIEMAAPTEESMTCETCGQVPCVCVKDTKKATHLWVIQHCTRPGCDSAIRSHDGLPEAELVCKWCRAKEEHGCAFAVYPDHVTHAPTGSESVTPPQPEPV